MVPHLVDGQDATADHLSLGGDEGGHDQTWAVTEAQARLHIQSLNIDKHTHTHTAEVKGQSTDNAISQDCNRCTGKGSTGGDGLPESAWCDQVWPKRTPFCSLKLC